MADSDNTTRICFSIEQELPTGPALILFARNTQTDESIVIKKLHEYEDARYNLKTRDERHNCLIEALKWNSRFTSNVYIGLGRICGELNGLNLSPGQIYLDQIVREPDKELLDPDAEYGLLMVRLPDERRLDNLLKSEEAATLWSLIDQLLEYIADVHKNGAAPATRADKDEYPWGSPEQLWKKLNHNIGLMKLEPIAAGAKDHTTAAYNRLQHDLRNIASGKTLTNYFEQRKARGHIKRCHGDLKAANIWITQRVQILDAIDFNPMYCNIDTLSDFAMLVVDIQARTKSADLARHMITYYLGLMGQEDDVAQVVLIYYLIEKAIVNAAISIVHDHAPEQGKAFIDIAEIYMKEMSQEKDGQQETEQC
jgi:aminoglycoside phosphotransferase family enzyme